MDHREQIAHHEAAHAVVAIRYGMGLSGGIDLGQPTSVEGAFGVAAVRLFEADAALSIEEQQLDLIRNLAVVCAGAASDARTTGAALDQALQAQPGDRALALRLALASPLVSDDDEAEHVVRLALERADQLLAKPEFWDAVVRVAAAALAGDGTLSKDGVERSAAWPPEEHDYNDVPPT